MTAERFAQLERQKLLAELSRPDRASINLLLAPQQSPPTVASANPAFTQSGLPLRNLDSAAARSQTAAPTLFDQLQRLQALNSLTLPPANSLPAQPARLSGLRGPSPNSGQIGGYGFAQSMQQLDFNRLHQSAQSTIPHSVASGNINVGPDSANAVAAALVARLRQEHESSGFNAQDFYSGRVGLGPSLSPSQRQQLLLASLGHQQANQHLGNPQPQIGDSIPLSLPVILARPEDNLKLSKHQVLLRHQIEAFKATEDDVSTHTRGRNKPVTLGQVGIRCRHCAHLPVVQRSKGSTYFPASMIGLYQAAQNMSTTHMQCGLCTEMPDVIKQEFARLMETKAASSGAGRPYWAETARKLGLVDTPEDGIRFIRDLQGLSVGAARNLSA